MANFFYQRIASRIFLSLLVATVGLASMPNPTTAAPLAPGMSPPALSASQPHGLIRVACVKAALVGCRRWYRHCMASSADKGRCKTQYQGCLREWGECNR